MRPLRREATPLPLVLLDAAVWTFRLPAGTRPRDRAGPRSRGHRAVLRRPLDPPSRATDSGTSRSPLDAGRSARAGDAVARAKLTAVVRFREQIGDAPRTLNLYQGYPFDRLRRTPRPRPPRSRCRSIGTTHLHSAAALARLEPDRLATVPVTEAYESAAALETITGQRGSPPSWSSDSPTLARLDGADAHRDLVREAMTSNASDVRWNGSNGRGKPNGGRDRRDLRASGPRKSMPAPAIPTTALQPYQAMLEQDPGDTAVGLDAAETLLDNGYAGHARPPAPRARSSQGASATRPPPGAAGPCWSKDARTFRRPTDNRGPLS